MDLDNTDPGRKESHEPVGRDKSRRKEEGWEKGRGGRANRKIGRQGREERRRPKEDRKMRSVEGKREEEEGTRGEIQGRSQG